MLKLLILIVLLSLLSGCATKFREQKEEDLVEKFNLDKSEMDQFKSIKVVKKKEGLPALKLFPGVVEKKVIIPPPHKDFKKNKILSQYPKDFPPKFIEYDEQFKNMWKLYRPVLFPGEEFKMVVRYLGITAGYVIINTLPPVIVANKQAWHFKARLKSADYYKYIYELDDSLETFISQDSFLPMKYQLIQRESVQEVDDLQLFDQKKFKTFFWYRRLKRGQLRKREKSSYIPKYIQDSFSALYFARGLPLKKGVVYEYPIVTRAKIWIIKFEVVGKEKIEYDDKEVNAFKIKAETRFPGVLKKKGDIIFWMSDDDRRLFLKFEAKVKIGSISGNLLKYWPNQQEKEKSIKKK